MGRLTSKRKKEIMDEYYRKYYKKYIEKYGSKIDAYIKKYFPEDGFVSKPFRNDSLNETKKNKSHALSRSFEKMVQMQKEEFQSSKRISMGRQSKKISKSHSRTLHLSKNRELSGFLYDMIKRRILVYELRNLIYRHIEEKSQLEASLKNHEKIQQLKMIGYGEWGTVYRISENRCIKIVNITQTLPNIRYIDFVREIKIATMAGELGVGPKIYDHYVIIDDSNSTAYGIIDMEFLHGKTLNEYLSQSQKSHGSGSGSLQEKIRIRDLFEEKVIKLHQVGILHSDLHADNIFLILDRENRITDLRIIDFGFSNFIHEYIYHRNHLRLNQEIFHFSREYIYNELNDYIYYQLFE